LLGIYYLTPKYMESSNMNTETFECRIVGETNDSYNVEFFCDCGKIHAHGFSKMDIGRASHRISHCEDNKGGYFIALFGNEVDRWEDKQKKV